MPTCKSYVFNSDSLKSLDGDYVEGYISTSDKDLVNDIVTPGCLVDMLQQLQNRPVTVDVEHETFRGKDRVERELNKALIPEGKVVDASLDSKGIKVKTVLNPHHSKYEEVKNSIKDGFLTAYSIAYVPQKFENKADGTRLLDRINLLNITYTGTPVNPEASITNVFLKSMQDNGGIEMSEEKAKAPEAGDKLENLEVKSLSEKVESLSKELSEMKAIASKKAEDEEEDAKKKKDGEEDKEDDEDEKKKEEAKKKAFDVQEVRIKAMEEQLKAIDVALSKPQLKAIIEAKTEQKSAVESTSVKGPVDMIR